MSRCRSPLLAVGSGCTAATWGVADFDELVVVDVVRRPTVDGCRPTVVGTVLYSFALDPGRRAVGGQAMDVYVLASYREGFPRSAMEAAASGLPIIATDIRGCRQVVDHDRTGLLVPVCDARALAAAVGRLATDPALRARMRDAALAKARAEFDDRRQVQITLDTYRRLLANG
jgi:hypothetical protein